MVNPPHHALSFALGRLLLHIPASVELLDVSPKVVDLLRVIKAGEDHLSTADEGPGILYIVLEVFFVPNDSRLPVRIRIVKIWNGASCATIEAIEFWANVVFRTGADRVAHLAFF